jgi:hypothetical protein
MTQAVEEEQASPPVMSKCARRRFKRNYILGIINGVMFRGSRIFIDEDTIIPVFIATLTQSKILVGLAVGLRLSGWYLPQLFVANSLGAKEKKNPTYIAWGFARVACILAIVLSVWLVQASNAPLLLTLFMVFWGMLYITAGMSGVSFVEVVAKTIPVQRLGGFYGYRLFFAGVISLGSGYLISVIQSAYRYPFDYGVMFLVAFFLIAAGIITWSLAAEQRDKVLRPKKPIREHLRESAGIFKADSQFRALLGFKAAFFLWWAGVPFYIRFAMEHFDWVDKYKGHFAVSKVIGLSLSNIIWARMSNSERWGGSRGILTWVSAVAMLLPLAVLPLGLGGVSSVALPVLFAVFLLAGAVQSGLVVGYMNALIRISPNERRPLYVGLMNTLLGPMILGLALSGGVIVEFASYEVMFIISSAAALLSLISARRLKSLNGQPAPATAIDRP